MGKASVVFGICARVRLGFWAICFGLGGGLHIACGGIKKNTSQTKYRRFCLRYRCAVCVCVFAGIERLTLRLGPSMVPHGTTWDRMGPHLFYVGPHFIS